LILSHIDFEIFKTHHLHQNLYIINFKLNQFYKTGFIK